MISDTVSRLRHAFIGAQDVVSPAFHFALFGLRKQRSRLANGLFITSIDVDVGSRKLGIINQGKYDRDITKRGSERLIGEIEQRNMPLLLDLFDEFEVPVTFAFRGQLIDVDISIPRHALRSSVRHEMGSHGYYHRAFTRLSREEANEELRMTSAAMNKLGVVPKSFAFPRNQIAHLDLLEKHGYICYRGLGGFLKDSSFIRKEHGELYDVHPSFYVGWIGDPFFVKRTIDICVRRKLPFHLWFHPRDLGDTEEQAKRRIRGMLSPLLKYAKRKEKVGGLTFETMYSATVKAKHS